MSTTIPAPTTLSGDGNGHDNADWGDAELMCPS